MPYNDSSLFNFVFPQRDAYKKASTSVIENLKINVNTAYYIFDILRIKHQKLGNDREKCLTSTSFQIP